MDLPLINNFTLFNSLYADLFVITFNLTHLFISSWLNITQYDKEYEQNCIRLLFMLKSVVPLIS